MEVIDDKILLELYVMKKKLEFMSVVYEKI